MLVYPSHAKLLKTRLSMLNAYRLLSAICLATLSSGPESKQPSEKPSKGEKLPLPKPTFTCKVL